MKKQLPSRPHLDHLRAEAKELLRSSSEISKLAEAQHAVAKSYGFKTWAQLRDYVDKVTLARLDSSNWLKRVDTPKFVQPHPNPEKDWWLALANGDLALVADYLSRDSGLANVAGGPLSRHPLHYVACLYVKSRDAVGCARALLDLGAEPNPIYFHQLYPDAPLAPLWGAVGIKHDFELTKLLLEGGANSNDNESLYHCMEHDEPEILQLLIDHGVVEPGTNGLARALDFNRIRQVEMILAAGADPNGKLGSENMLHHAIRRGRTLPFIELLVKHGVDLGGLSNERLSVVSHAALRSNWEVYEYLRELTGGSLSSEEEFVAQVRNGRAVTAEKPEKFSALVLSLLPLAALQGEVDRVAALLDAGWPVDAPDNGSVSGAAGATSLHCACFAGYAGMVRLLIERGATLDPERLAYGSTPIGWALYGEVNSQIPGGDHEACIRLMIEAGCKKPNSEWTASDDMRDVLAEYGYWGE